LKIGIELWAAFLLLVGLVVGFLGPLETFYVIVAVGVAAAAIMVLWRRFTWLLPVLAGVLGLIVGRVMI
jgi:hypothetical protein